MQKMCRCLLLAVAFVALADGHSLTGLKAHRSRRAVVQLTTEQKKLLVDKHNELRRLAGASDMEKMVWDDELASMATWNAGRCVYGHAQPANATKKAGQNIYGQYGRPLDFAYFTQTWYDEVKDYTYDSKTCSGAACGHYTQIVWAESRELGCAVARCDPLGGKVQATGPADYFVCNYGPPGNNLAVHPYKKGAVCSTCRSGSGWCEDGLCSRDCKAGDENCVCDLKCANGGVLNENTCSCTCKNGWMGTDCTRECKNDDVKCGDGWPKRWCNDAKQFPWVTRDCPLMCGQCAPGCANSGVFNEETKSCDCAKGWSGADCTSECKNKHISCGNGWPKMWCDEPNIYPWVVRNCPLMCGLCEQ